MDMHSEQARFSATTDGVTVAVEPEFLGDQSTPEEEHYVWAYHVEILNHGDHAVQLLRRHWSITDSLGRRQEVDGEGVVGEQPVIEPGDRFEYTSACPLSTPSGVMVGRYTLQDRVSGGLREVAVPAFSLDSPHETAAVN